jgi:isoleucyl-tRNA synthetase
VRMVQSARRDAGLHLADRIRLAVELPPTYAAAAAEHRDYLASETLAIEVVIGSVPAGMNVHETELDGGVARVGVARA